MAREVPIDAAFENLSIRDQDSWVEVGVRRTDDEKTSASAREEILDAFGTVHPQAERDRILALKGTLLESSCDWVFEDGEFSSWLSSERSLSDDDNDDDNRLSNVLWIHGEPGKGKTMIFDAAIRYLEQRAGSTRDSGSNEAVVSYFFVQATDSRVNTAVAIMRGLVYLLVEQDGEMMKFAIEKHRSDTGIIERMNTFSMLWSLFEEILSASKMERIYLCIDALDECGTGHAALLSNVCRQARSNKKVRWLFTSRTEPWIRERVEFAETAHNISLEANAEHVDQTIRRFVTKQVDYISRLKQYSPSLQAAVEDHLQQNAEGTFLWVALVCSTLENMRRRDVEANLAVFPAGLGSLYQQMLSRIEKLNEDSGRLHKDIIRTAAVAYRPLSFEELRMFADVGGPIRDVQSMEELVEECASFLVHRQGKVYFVHQSAQDFVTKKESEHGLFSRGVELEHRRLLKILLGHMRLLLKNDICNLKTPGVAINRIMERRIQASIPSSLQYACNFWSQHLTAAKSIPIGDDGIYEFLRRHLLHWLEALCWMRKLTIANGMVESLSLLAKTEKHGEISALLHDLERLLAVKGSLIAVAPLQIYASALVFAPYKSLIRQLFAHDWPVWLKNAPEVDQTWPSCAAQFELPSDSSPVITVSPDGTLLAAGSTNGLIRVWSIQNREIQAVFAVGSQVCDLVFSRDGTQMVAATAHGEAIVWNTQSWVEERDQTFGKSYDCDNGQVIYGALIHLSRNGDVAMFRDPRKVEIVDVLSGLLTSPVHVRIDIPLTNWPCQLSADGKYMAWLTGHKDKRTLVLIYNVKTSKQIAELKHSASVQFCFSTSGSLSASASADGKIFIWDFSVSTTLPIKVLSGHTAEVQQMKFSEGDRYLVCPHNNNTITIWDLTSWSLVSTLKPVAENSYYLAVSISDDGTLLAMTSFEPVVNIFDVMTGRLVAALRDHDDVIFTLKFLHGSKLLLSSSGDQTVRLWNTAKTQLSLEGIDDKDGGENIIHGIQKVQISPDGSFVFGMQNGSHTVVAWDTQTWVKRKLAKLTLGIMEMLRFTFRFSPNSKLMACPSSGGNVALFTLPGGTWKSLKGHPHIVSCLSFSPNNEILVVGYADGQTLLWYLNTVQMNTVQKVSICRYSDRIQDICFSASGSKLAVSAADEYISIHDIAKGDKLAEFSHAVYWKGREDFPWAPEAITVTFSSDERLIAVAHEVDEYVAGFIYDISQKKIVRDFPRMSRLLPERVTFVNDTEVGLTKLQVHMGQNGAWISWKGTRMMSIAGFIDPDYRSCHITGDRMALGNRHKDRVLFLQFDSSRLT